MEEDEMTKEEKTETEVAAPQDEQQAQVAEQQSANESASENADATENSAPDADAEKEAKSEETAEQQDEPQAEAEEQQPTNETEVAEQQAEAAAENPAPVAEDPYHFDVQSLNEYYKKENIDADAETMFVNFVEANYTEEQQQIILEQLQARSEEAKNRGLSKYKFKMKGIGGEEGDYAEIESVDGEIKSFKLRDKDGKDVTKLRYEKGSKKTKVTGKEKKYDEDGTKKKTIFKIRSWLENRYKAKQKETTSASAVATLYGVIPVAAAAEMATESHEVKSTKEGGVEVKNTKTNQSVSEQFVILAAGNVEQDANTYYYDKDGKLIESEEYHRKAELGMGAVKAGYQTSHTEYAEDGTAKRKDAALGLSLGLGGVEMFGDVTSITFDPEFNIAASKEIKAGANVGLYSFSLECGKKMKFVDSDGNLSEKGVFLKTEYGTARILCAAGCYVKKTNEEGKQDLAQNGMNVDVGYRGVVVQVEVDGVKKGVVMTPQAFVQLMQEQGYQIDNTLLKSLMQEDHDNYADIIEKMGNGMVIKKNGMVMNPNTEQAEAEEKAKAEDEKNSYQKPEQQDATAHKYGRKYRENGGR